MISYSSLFTHCGTRSCQEDYALVDTEKSIFVVADGFGGPTIGDLASQSVSEAIRSFLRKGIGDLDATLPFVLRSYYSLAANVLFNAFIHANQTLLESQRSKPIQERGGASVIAGFLDGDTLSIASSGACEGFMIRGGQRMALNSPKTLARLTNPFASDREWASAHDCPLQALGFSNDLEPEMTELKIQPQDLLVLQTDGMGTAWLDEFVFGQTNLDTFMRELKLRDYSDNASLVLVRF